MLLKAVKALQSFALLHMHSGPEHANVQLGGGRGGEGSCDNETLDSATLESKT